MPSFKVRNGSDQVGYNADHAALQGQITTLKGQVSIHGNALAVLQKAGVGAGKPGPIGPVGPAGPAGTGSGGISTLGSVVSGTGLDVTISGSTGNVVLSLAGTLDAANGGTGSATFPANQVFAGPVAGADAAPVARALVAADMPFALPSFADGETPAGTVDGSNKVFTVANAPNPGASLHLYLSGLRVALSGYTLSGATITFATAPVIGSSLLADYRY